MTMHACAATTGASLFGGGIWEVKEIDASPCAPLVKVEPVMHFCVGPEARALTTTLSAKT